MQSITSPKRKLLYFIFSLLAAALQFHPILNPVFDSCLNRHLCVLHYEILKPNLGSRLRTRIIELLLLTLQYGFIGDILVISLR